MKIFLAGWFDSRERLRLARDTLNKMGHTVRSRWLDEETPPPPDDAEVIERAVIDMEDLAQVEVLVLDTLDEDHRGGREVEFGYFLRRADPLFIVGPRRNIYHAFAEAQFESWDHAFAYFRGRRVEEEEKHHVPSV